MVAPVKSVRFSDAPPTSLGKRPLRSILKVTPLDLADQRISFTPGSVQELNPFTGRSLVSLNLESFHLPAFHTQLLLRQSRLEELVLSNRSRHGISLRFCEYLSCLKKLTLINAICPRYSGKEEDEEPFSNLGLLLNLQELTFCYSEDCFSKFIIDELKVLPPRLISLQLMQYYFRNEKSLGMIPSLSLRFLEITATDPLLAELSKGHIASTLEELVLSSHSEVTEKGLAVINKFTALKKLTLPGGEVKEFSCNKPPESGRMEGQSSKELSDNSCQ